MDIDSEFEEIIKYIDEWRKGEHGLVVTDVVFNNTLELIDLTLKGEYRVNCKDLFVETKVFEDFYKRMLSARVSYGENSALFEETIRVVREQLVEKFYNGLDVVNEEMTTAVDVFKKELSERLKEIELGSNIVVIFNFNNVTPVLLGDDFEVLKDLVM